VQGRAGRGSVWYGTCWFLLWCWCLDRRDGLRLGGGVGFRERFEEGLPVRLHKDAFGGMNRNSLLAKARQFIRVAAPEISV
jgi:hypothetical protein